MLQSNVLFSNVQLTAVLGKNIDGARVLEHGQALVITASMGLALALAVVGLNHHKHALCGLNIKQQQHGIHTLDHPDKSIELSQLIRRSHDLTQNYNSQSVDDQNKETGQTRLEQGLGDLLGLIQFVTLQVLNSSNNHEYQNDTIGNTPRHKGKRVSLSNGSVHGGVVAQSQQTNVYTTSTKGKEQDTEKESDPFLDSSIGKDGFQLDQRVNHGRSFMNDPIGFINKEQPSNILSRTR